ncbi:MAG: ferredoxin [Candidatus Moranbacteria bacterium]|nr:ferredoxin [Candidatus Moranbacteria bacterium]
MNISIDEDKCIGCGVCQSLCPECFELKGNTAQVIKEECEECAVEDVAKSCPTEAIVVSRGQEKED